MRATSTLCKLESLPDELLNRIVELLLTQRDICAMCLVSRRINAIADPCLYNSVSFNQPKYHIAFSESLAARPRRGSSIHHVRLEYPSSKLSDIIRLRENSNQLDNFSHAISTMSNLENIVISVPESLCRGIGTLLNGPFDLACLKSCALFYQCEDNEYWDLQENIHIFGHPTLESLTIRRAKLDHRGFESLERPEETSLRELHLIECDINDDGLSDLLQIPSALEEITMTQLEVPNPPLVESPDDIEDFILAMHAAQHSLKTISIDFATLGAENPLKLRGFDSLKSLELRDYQLFGQSRLDSVGLPPNLEVLKFLNQVGEDDDEMIDLLCYIIENKSIMARKLQQIIVVQDDSLPLRLIEACETTVGLHLSTLLPS